MSEHKETLESEDIVPRVFLSYSSKDAQVIEPVIGALRREGLKILSPFEDPARSWGVSIQQSIEETISTRAHAVIVFLSHQFIDSHWCKFELEFLSKEAARRDATPIILPVRLDDCQPPAFLSDRIYLDFEKLGPDKIAHAAKERISTLSLIGPLLRMMPDEALVRRYAAEHDEGALRILYERLYPQIYRWCRTSRLKVDASEVADEVLRKLKRNAVIFTSERGNFSAWIAQITRYAAVDCWRKERKLASRLQSIESRDVDEIEGREPEISLSKEPSRLYDPAKSPSELAEQADLIRNALEKLSERERAILELNAQGLTYSEIAEQLGITQSAARIMWHRTVHALRDKMIQTLKNG